VEIFSRYIVLYHGKILHLSTLLAVEPIISIRIGNLYRQIESFENMGKKPRFHLKETDLKKDQIIKLTKLVVCQLDIAKHSMRGILTTVVGCSQLGLHGFEDILSNLGKDFIPQMDQLQRTYNNFKNSHIAIERLIISMNAYFGLFSSYRSESILITKPIEVIKILRNIWINIHIKISHRSLKSLEIFFPGNLFFGMIFELISNAQKNCINKKCEILIEWYIKGSKFECHIHDNGTGIIPSSYKGFIATDMLSSISKIKLKQDGGIRIIDKILRLSRGMILFSRSKKLGGTYIIISFPVFAYYHKKSRS